MVVEFPVICAACDRAGVMKGKIIIIQNIFRNRELYLNTERKQ